MTHTDRPERPQGPPPLAPDAQPPEARAPEARASQAQPDCRPAPGARRIAPAVARQIDENLKLLYQSRVEEELPPQLRDLVARLRRSDGDAG